MNLYLEHPQLWTEVHHRLITAIADEIAPSLRPKYRVAIEKRIYLHSGEESVLVGIPDAAVTSQLAMSDRRTSIATLSSESTTTTVRVPVPQEAREGYLEIRDVETGSVVTAIEVLSPTNKRSGVGREKYRGKRMAILGTSTHLVEIDLVKMGQPTETIETVPKTDYRILICRGDRRLYCDLYGFNLPDPIPVAVVPLRAGDREPTLDLYKLLTQLYDRAAFDLAIDYHGDPVLPLTEEDRSWLDRLLQDKELR